MVVYQYEIFIVDLDPTLGHEIKKQRPCLIISPNEMNHSIQTIIIAPVTTKSHNYPTRVNTKIGGRESWIVLDQIRALDKIRLIRKVGKLDAATIQKVKAILSEMLVE